AIIALVPVIAKGIESVTSIGEVILSDDVESNDGKRKIADVQGRFTFQDVYFGYKDGGKNTLNGLNLEVAPGETLALVGESGVGKTTILNMVIGFYLTDRGQVLLDGQNLNEIDLRSYRKYLAVVPQTSILFSGTIRDNITYGCENVTDAQLDQVIRAANLKELIDSLPDGLDTKVGEHGGKLSGGQRQRVSIARALIRDPRVIVLDEATSALDSISEKLIQEAVNNLTANRTTFIVAHRLSTIRDADKIAVIDEGRCVEYGTYDELIALQGRFYQMKKIQS
ncbi:MAG: ATP-binding cassette domain-containing protein, partial [Acetatifactor sp.]|nr:ATP-binding cassette domain-containing protein [Acetatifactor sp.]